MGNKLIWAIVASIVVLGGVYLLMGKGGYVTPSPGGGEQMAPTAPVVAGPTEGALMETITLDQSGFSPKEVKIKVGTKVVWVNQSGALATVNSAQHPTHLIYPPLNLGEFADGASLELVFDQPGTYPYHNHLNPTQFGLMMIE